MIGHYLSNNNESATVSKPKHFRELNGWELLHLYIMGTASFIYICPACASNNLNYFSLFHFSFTIFILQKIVESLRE